MTQYEPQPQNPGQQNITVNVTHEPKGVNHVLHLILTIITCGLWAPVWIVLAIAGRR